MKTKSENRKAMPKFILTMIGALVLGGVLGVAIVFTEGHWAVSLSAALTKALATAAPWLLTADAIINTVVVWSLYKKAQRIFKSLQDSEDEEQLDRIETILNSALIVNNICSIADDVRALSGSLYLLHGEHADWTAKAGGLCQNTEPAKTRQRI